MWQIEEHRNAQKQLSGPVPNEVLRRYEKWKAVIKTSGPQGLRSVPGFHDEALLGKWWGFRSSRLGLQWRVIYRTVANVLHVYVVQVTPHDYRR
jgi:proteic killer suppression protein